MNVSKASELHGVPLCSGFSEPAADGSGLIDAEGEGPVSWWEAVAALRSPCFELEGYLRRWRLSHRHSGGHGFLHHLRHRDEPTPHSHPWPFDSFVLKGWYEAVGALGRLAPLADGRQRVLLDGPMRPYRASVESGRQHYPANHYHYITEVSEGGCWTLVVTGAKAGPWGFIDREGLFVPHESYVGDRPGETRRHGY